MTQVEAPAGGEAEAPPKGYERRLVTLLTIGNGIAALDAQAVFYLMPFIVADLGLNNSQVGYIGSAVLVGWSLAAFAVGLASDHVGRRKPFLVAAFLCFALFSGLSALATSFAGLLLARLVIGLAEGPVLPMAHALVMGASAPKRRGLNMGLVQNLGAQLIGTLAAPLILVWLAERAGWRSAFLISAVPALLVAIWAWRTIKERPLRPERSAPTALRGVDVAARLKAILAVHNIRMCLLITTCCVAWYFMLLTFLPLRLTKELGVSNGSMSVIVGMIGAAGALSSILVSGLADRIGRRSTIIIFCFVGALAPLGSVVFGSSTLLIGACVLVGGLMVGNIALLMGTVPQESVSAENSATATALVLCVAQLAGGIVGPAVGGVLGDRFGLQAPMMLAAGLALAAGVLAFGLRETRRDSQAA